VIVTVSLHVDMIFPRWQLLLPKADDAELSGGAVGFDPAQLAVFAKVARPKGTPMVLHFHGPTRPVLVTIGERFRGLIMPVRTELS
jgi:hypothetical protein